MRFKEPWKPDNCYFALSKHGLYEAAGNVCWINPLQGLDVPQDSPSWKNVVELSKKFAKSRNQQDLHNEILWPLPVYCVVKSQPAQDAFPVTMFCIAGHALLFAWYYAVAKAMDSNDTSWLRQLFRCGLSVTITLHYSTVQKNLILIALKSNENYGAAEDLVETFPIFAKRVENLLNEAKKNNLKLDDRVAYLVECGVMYKKTSFSKPLLNACIAMKRFSTRSYEILRLIHKEFGQEVFDGYGKLPRLSQSAGQICEAIALQGYCWFVGLTLTYLRGCCFSDEPVSVQGDQLAEEAIEWTLEFAYVSLKRQDCQPHFFKIQNLDNGKGGAAGWFAAHLQKFLLVRHLLEVPKKMELSDLQDAVSLLSTPLAWNSNCPKASEDENAEAEEQKPTHSDAVSKAMAKLTEEHKSFFLFAKCLMEGDFNKNLNEMCGTKGFRIVSALFNQDNSSAHKNMEIVIELNKALKGLTETRPVSTTTSSEAPGLGARALAVLQNEDHDHVQRERAEVWSKAQAARKKLVTLAAVSSAGDIQTLFWTGHRPNTSAASRPS